MLRSKLGLSSIRRLTVVLERSSNPNDMKNRIGFERKNVYVMRRSSRANVAVLGAALNDI